VALAALFLLGSCLNVWSAAASSDTGEEKRIEALEQQFFSQTYKSDSDDTRLARIEDMLFNHARSGSTGERLASLEDALGDIKSSTKAPPAKTSSSSTTSNGTTGSSTGNNSRYRHFADMDDQDSDGDGFNSPASNFYNQASPGALQTSPSSSAGAKSGTLVTQQLAAMETQIFGKPNLKMPLLNRVKKLEQNVLSSGTDTSTMSLPDRIKNLWTNLNSPSATTGNSTKNKTPVPTAAEDSAPPPTTTTARKRPQAKAEDDDVSDDQAMAEYLQKLKKGTSVSANASSTGKRSSSNVNKSGWVDDSQMPSKGLDPDYSSNDDNPPIVVGGNSSMSSMQAQGSVQNFSSGMGMNMGVPSQNPGLFSKLGQAIGGAVNGGNNPYGYGGMYGGSPNIMPYGYGGMSPYGAGLPYGGISPYGGYGGLNPYGGYGMTPPVMGPSLGGIGGYGNVSPYGVGGPRGGNPYGINPYAASPQPYGYGGVVRRF
jgi:hypothetical protein